MNPPARSYHGKFIGAVSFAALAYGFWAFLPWPADMPGSLESVFASLQMDCEDEAVAVIEGFSASCMTKDGQSRVISAGPLIDNLPPLDEIAGSLIALTDSAGRVEVTLGPGGLVLHTQVPPGVWQYWLDKVWRTLARAESDLLSGPWWKHQGKKAYRSLCRRWK